MSGEIRIISVDAEDGEARFSCKPVLMRTIGRFVGVRESDTANVWAEVYADDQIKKIVECPFLVRGKCRYERFESPCSPQPTNLKRIS
jgi:hypothetical protein